MKKIATAINKKEEILKKLTFGFEIEGTFHNDLINYLKDNELGRFSSDGSVNSADDCSFDDFNLDSDYEEFKSFPVNYDKAMDLLAKFTADNYYYNNSCGLHLHIKFNGEYLRNSHALFNNYKFIKKLQTCFSDFNKTLCQCQRERMTADRSYYCKNYKNKHDLYTYGYKDNNKYQFMRFHPQGTLEFRFLMPCEHKVKNTATLINMICEYLADNEIINRKKIDLETNSTETINNIYKLNKKNLCVIQL